jgi:hypothetical protein
MPNPTVDANSDDSWLVMSKARRSRSGELWMVQRAG